VVCRFQIHKSLSIALACSLFGLDNKGTGLECQTLGGDAEMRCYNCTTPAENWGAMLQFQPRILSLHDLAVRHLHTLFYTLSSVVTRFEEGKTDPRAKRLPALTETTKIFTKMTKESGSYGFPLPVLNNPTAIIDLMGETAALLGHEGPCDSLSESQKKEVADCFTQLLELEAQLRNSPFPSTSSAYGFSLKHLRPAVAKMHAIKCKPRLTRLGNTPLTRLLFVPQIGGGRF
jgi:hypothetical protein